MATPSVPGSAASGPSLPVPLLSQQQQQQQLLPQQPLSLQPSPACVMGQPVPPGSVVMGIPLGMPPWLPPPISQQAASLPILPVGPMSPAQELAQHAEQPSPPSSRDSRGTGSPARALRSSGSSHGRTSARPRTLPRPTSRQQQLFRWGPPMHWIKPRPASYPLAGGCSREPAFLLAALVAWMLIRGWSDC